MLRRAIVVDNLDPEGRGRIKVIFPDARGRTKHEGAWVDYCTPYGGWDNADGSGFYWIPSVGSQVWVLKEDNGPNLVYIGQSFFGERGLQNPPIEGQTKRTEPAVRIIKSLRGHKLIFDDRIEDDSGSRPIDIRLENANGSGLRISDHKGTTLNNDSTSLTLYRNSLSISVGGNSVIFKRDEFKLNTRQAGIDVQNGNVDIRAQSSIRLDGGPIEVKTRSSITIEAITGDISGRAANVSLLASGDASLGSAGSLSLTGGSIIESAMVGGTIDIYAPLPVSGASGLFIDSTSGQISIHSGPSINTEQATRELTNGRLVIGGLSGDILLEGRSGGLYIASTPAQLSGSAGGLVRAVTGSITPTLSQTGPQPVVLGGNLKQLLEQLLNGIDRLIDSFLQNAPNISTGGAGPNILNPAIVAQLTTLKATIAAIKTAHLNQVPTPTNILSSLVFVEG